jgi:hypothetical protein
MPNHFVHYEILIFSIKKNRLYFKLTLKKIFLSVILWWRRVMINIVKQNRPFSGVPGVFWIIVHIWKMFSYKMQKQCIVILKNQILEIFK